MTARPNAHRLAALARALAPFAFGLIAGAPFASAGPGDSPFLPPAGAVSVAANSPTENLEFAGWNSVGGKTYISIFDKQAKKSRWILVGGAEGGLSVLAYDPRREQVVVKSGDLQKTLTLRKSNGVAAGPAPVALLPAASGFAAPAAPVVNSFQPPPPPSGPALEPNAKPPADPKPQTIARQEEEARMLVSDLLEIGMAQRKAYEEAQKKASEQPAPPPPPTGP